MFRSMQESEAEQVGAAVPYLDADPTREQLPTDDYLEVWLANEGGTGDIQVQNLDVTI